MVAPMCRFCLAFADTLKVAQSAAPSLAAWGGPLRSWPQHVLRAAAKPCGDGPGWRRGVAGPRAGSAAHGGSSTPWTRQGCVALRLLGSVTLGKICTEGLSSTLYFCGRHMHVIMDGRIHRWAVSWAGICSTAVVS